MEFLLWRMRSSVFLLKGCGRAVSFGPTVWMGSEQCGRNRGSVHRSLATVLLGWPRSGNIGFTSSEIETSGIHFLRVFAMRVLIFLGKISYSWNVFPCEHSPLPYCTWIKYLTIHWAPIVLHLRAGIKKGLIGICSEVIWEFLLIHSIYPVL